MELNWFNTLRPRQNGRRFADDTFKRIFLNENVRISIKISLKFVPKGPINNNPALVQIMAWRRSGDKPLSEPMMVILLTHICVTRPQWVNNGTPIYGILNSYAVCLFFLPFKQRTDLLIHETEEYGWLPHSLTLKFLSYFFQNVISFSNVVPYKCSTCISVCWVLILIGNRVISNRKETSYLPLLNAGFEPRVSGTEYPADWIPADKPTELSRIKLKTWTQ